MIAVSIHSYLTKYWAKQLLPFHYTNNELREVLYEKCIIKMSKKVKDIDIKIHTYHFFNKIIITKSCDLNNIKIDENSYRNILIYCIEYAMIKYSKYVKTCSVNPLYLIFKKVNEYFEKININKYLTLQSVTKYLRLTLVFMWNSALRESFYCYFSGILC